MRKEESAAKERGSVAEIPCSTKRHMHAGLIWQQEGCGVVMGKFTRKAFGFEINDFLYIESEDRGTRICRQLRDFPIKSKASKGYAYVDKDSLDLLNVDMHDCLWVYRADITFEAP